MNVVRTLEQELAQAKRQVRALSKAITAFRTTLVRNNAGGRPYGKKRTMRAAARRKISLAPKARWAKRKRTAATSS